MTKEQIRQLGLTHFDRCGFASLYPSSASVHRYEQWLHKGQQGEMTYLERHLPLKKDPQKLLPNAKSWISFLSVYDSTEPLSADLRCKLLQTKKGWIARYARGHDYHSSIFKKHKKMVVTLSTAFPHEQFLSCVDSKPVLERDLAMRSGLGWIGKNTCLINRQLGSFIFLSEILTTLEIEADNTLSADHCGTCTRCIDACPTGALEPHRQLNAQKCISYWTIESKREAPPALSQQFAPHFFGCDICQDVCPWNQKPHRAQTQAPKMSGVIDPEWVLRSSETELKQHFKGTAISRAKPAKLKAAAARLLKE